MDTRAYMNWSGGKDSALALYHYLQQGTVCRLLTNVNAAYERVSMHGVRRSLLETQTTAIGIPLETIELPEQPSMAEYESAIRTKLSQFKKEGIEEAIFGDIFLEDLKQYREQQLSAIGMKAVFPLWKRDTRELLHEFIDLGFQSIVVCTKAEALGEEFAGRLLNHSFLDDLPPGVDPCGENGEYHSFVFDGPIFKHPVPFVKGETVYREYEAPKADKEECFTTPQPKMGFYFCDLIGR